MKSKRKKKYVMRTVKMKYRTEKAENLKYEGFQGKASIEWLQDM